MSRTLTNLCIVHQPAWPDDAHWMPLFLEDKKFKGKFLFGEGDVILEKEVQVVENL